MGISGGRENERERMIIKIKKKEGGMKIQKTFPNLFSYIT